MNNLFFCAEKSVIFVFTGRKHPVFETHQTCQGLSNITCQERIDCSPEAQLLTYQISHQSPR